MREMGEEAVPASAEDLRKEAELLTAAKEKRASRKNAIEASHRYIIDVAAELFGTTGDELIEGIVDSQRHIEILQKFCEENGSKAFFIFYDTFDYVSKDSGRYVHQNRHEKLLRAILSNGTDAKQDKQCIVVYRNNNAKKLDVKNLMTMVGFAEINVDSKCTIATALASIFQDFLIPTCDKVTAYGHCSAANKKSFIFKLGTVGDFFNDSNHVLQSLLTFTVDHALYNDHLMSDIQIEKTVQNRQLICAVENSFNGWMRTIRTVLFRGQQTRRDYSTVGPADELAFWRYTLSIYTNVAEFTATKEFEQHLQCLKLSLSKLVTTWQRLNEQLVMAINEATDNVQFVSSLEPFYNPLYRDINEIHHHIPALFKTLRNLYRTSIFYNTSDAIAGFLFKCTNHLVNVCKNDATNYGVSPIFTQSLDEIVKKIGIYDYLLKQYRAAYESTNELIRSKLGESIWEFSPNYVFGMIDLFMERLEKIKTIIETKLKYSILSKIHINNIESFAKPINDTHEIIIRKKYEHVDIRETAFEEDFKAWKQKVEQFETEMHRFVKDSLVNINLMAGIRLIKRFENLHFDCLALDRRYLDQAVLFTEDINKIKDNFNLVKSTPPLANGVCLYSGCIIWVRSLQKKLDEIMDVLKQKKCIIEHEKVQKTIKNYNSLSKNFALYEMQQYKAWFDDVSQVYAILAQPIIRKCAQTNRMEVNFEPKIFDLIRESEAMLKLNLAVPHLSQVVIFRRDSLQQSVEKINYLISLNDELRLQSDMFLLRIFRPVLLHLEKSFKPALTRIQWLSTDLHAYLKNLEQTLADIQTLNKDIQNMKNCHIESVIHSITKVNLAILPDEPIDIETLCKMNVEQSKKVGVLLEKKSLMAEKATVKLIKLFVDFANVPAHDDKGNRVFSLPDSEINETNRRTEHKLPIDKYDWLSLKKMFQPVVVDPEHERHRLYFKDYENAPYLVKELHNDCMEIFNYFTNLCIEALAKCIKQTFETIKQYFSNAEKPAIVTIAKLNTDKCYIEPCLNSINQRYLSLIQNVLETLRGVASWGEQAKTEARQQRQPLPDESTHEKTYFQLLSEHKDVVRLKRSFDAGLLVLQPKVNLFLEKMYAQHCYLWVTNIDDTLKEFADSKPLTIEISDKFKSFDERSAELNATSKFVQIEAIGIELTQLYDDFVTHSNNWKKKLGEFLSEIFKAKLQKFVEFVENVEDVLSRPLTDLDDVSIAITCLESVRENNIVMEIEMYNVIDVYAVFAKFGITVDKDDCEQVDMLAVKFKNMLANAKRIEAQIGQMKDALFIELTKEIENLKENIIIFDHDYLQKGPMIENLLAKEASDRTFLFQSRFEELWNKFQKCQAGEKLFGLAVSDYPILHKRQKELNLLSKLYSLYLLVLKRINNYAEISWQSLDMPEILAEINDFQVKCRQLPKAMQTWNAFIAMKEKIEDFSETCPLIELMKSDSMKTRHWDQLQKLMSYEFDTDNSKTTLGYVLEAPLLQFKDEIQDICVAADKERDIEAKLAQVISDWSSVNIKLTAFKARGDVMLKASDCADIVTQLEDSQMMMNSLASNRYNKPFKKEVMLWVAKLNKTADLLDKWMVVQSLWVYLEAVFVGGDIAKQLPAETKRFAIIDTAYIKLMHRAREVQNVIEVCTADDTMMRSLATLVEQLEACRKSLVGYLEKKRLIFPRFFFISDQVLLEILGQASNPPTIQPHMPSLFDAIERVDFQEKTNDKIVAFNSRNGEKVAFEKTIACVGGVEEWLGTLLSDMQSTINNLLCEFADNLLLPNFDFCQEFRKGIIGQASLIGVQILWTTLAEKAIKKSKSDSSIMRNTNQWFLNLLNQFIEITTLDLTKLDRVRCETMVTIHVHQRDIFDDLTRLKVKQISDFEWQKQARFYYDKEHGEIWVRITDINFLYQNEYLGVVERLAITPLTDRCYITLAQAIGMNFGGAPAGPAGTGKTETTKDMGRTLGKFVVVFNCSDQMDFRGLGRIFKGLAQAGCWGCFDEFNRIELPVLSVAAQQVSIILTARKKKQKSFIFSDGDTVSLNPEFAFFITMNPGYAGRQELPENLKIQFRSVAMMVPDRQIIIRVKLASCGFKENVVLARKFFMLYKLCELQLSKQVHYDFGLRNILSVLRTLGAQKRANPSETEEYIMMRVLRDMNLSKLIDEDEPLFLSLISDLFPNIKLGTTTDKLLRTTIEAAVEKFGYVNTPMWNLKIVQLYDTSLVRHGVMVMGPSGAGKTSCTKVLLETFTVMGSKHFQLRMNPKSITASEMFGRLDAATNDWTDGIFSVLWRRCVKIDASKCVWLVLDGPVDAVWIENLNSVLDDNKTLTLANGDRIVMTDNFKLLFEPDNVDNASPATVSRMGMVFMSSSVLPWTSLLEAWLKQQPNEYQIIKRFFDLLYNEAEQFVRVNLVAKIDLLEIMYIRQMLSVLDGLLVDVRPSHSQHLERLFLFAMMWSIGAVLELDDRAKFELFVITHPSKLNWPKPKSGDTIFDYFVDNNGSWMHWSNKVESFIYPKDVVLDYSSILIPNVDNTRTAFLIDTIAKQKRPVLLIGEQGTAKTVMTKRYMLSFDKTQHLFKSINFSSATSPNFFQKTIESYVEKRAGLSYGPPLQCKLTVFIDDINMPVVNEWGDQITNELTRQLIEQSGFYSLERPGDFLTMLDLQYLAAMIHPGGGRNDIPSRLKQKFCIFNCTLPSNQSMDKIFTSIAEGYFCDTRFNAEIVNFVSQLVPLTRVLWQKTKIKMLPTPAKFHYVFNLRDLSRIWQGILTIKGGECQNARTIMKLWRHECMRVISDRFTTYEDKQWFDQKMGQTVKEDFTQLHSHYDPVETYFVDFLREVPEPADGDEEVILVAPKIYEEIPSFEFATDRANVFLAKFKEIMRGYKLDLVFFHDCLVHIIIISRIIRMPGGNALLVGVGGAGKQSVSRLASFIAEYRFHQIELTKTYGTTSLLDDIKLLYRAAGIENKGVTFIVTENEIKDEAFLEYINNILSTGEIANLFSKDEMDELIEKIEPSIKTSAPDIEPTRDNCYDFFLNRCKQNLHVVLCFSPIGEKFRNRALKFPGLISGCTIDWYQRWPDDAQIAVAKHYLSDYFIDCTPQVKASVIRMMNFIQNHIFDLCTEYYERYRRQSYVTPKILLSFLQNYMALYKEKYGNVNALSKRMQVGIAKMIEAGESVGLLKEELVQKNIEIEVMSKEADEILEEVAKVAEVAEAIKAEVSIMKESAEALVSQIEMETAKAQEQLELAQPALDEAAAALNTITGADIATVRKLGKPPYLITVIMDVVLILFRRKLVRVKPDKEKNFMEMTWTESAKFLADASFLSKIVKYPKDTINGEMIDLMVPYLMSPTYTFEKAKQACGNVAGLLKWTIAMTQFFDVNKDVLPLKANLAIQQANYVEAQNQLQSAQEQFAAKEAELSLAQQTLNEAETKKAFVVDDAKKCVDKMNAATALIDGLADEKLRWTEQIEAFKAEIHRLVGDVIYLSAFLSYAGPFNQEFRAKCQQVWYDEIVRLEIPISENIAVAERLSDMATIGQWNVQGLPNDELSIQNGIIVTKATRYPLLIDPQKQGKEWIKNLEKDNQLVVTTLSHRLFRTHVEDALAMGHSILIEDIGEELDPVLDNVLEKNLIKVGTMYKLKFGDKEIDFVDSFRLFITTKLPNPTYTPEIFAKTSVIDFTVTKSGLEEQLLNRVILIEKNELEQQRIDLVIGINENRRTMQEIESNLLNKLSTIQGSLLDDLTLITTLNTSKITAIEVKEKLEVAKNTEIKVNAAREEFRSIAQRGSLLYFLICSFAMINVMYQTSLDQFLERFDLSMHLSEKTSTTKKRIKIIIDYLNFDIFTFTTRGLFEAHKFLFALLMTLNIDLQLNKIAYHEFDTFIKGGGAMSLNECPKKPHDWINDIAWLNLNRLSQLDEFKNILQQIVSDGKSWKTWAFKNQPENDVFPSGYSRLNEFKKLLLIRSCFPDRIYSQSVNYISWSMGKHFASSNILSYDILLSDSRSLTPIVCFLSTGSDPTPNIQQLAKKNEIECLDISMGQGQEIHARRMLTECVNDGKWLLLQNCHLGLDYMSELVDQFTELVNAPESFSEKFRCWITTEAHPSFPITLLQMSIKYTNDPPSGMRAGLTRVYGNLNQDLLDHSDSPLYLPLVYGVSFLYTVVQERRKFGALGWCIPYEFNSADWLATCTFMQNHLEMITVQKKPISWQTIRYMLGEVQFGGRVTDDYDKRLLNTFARVYFSDRMFDDSYEFFRGFSILKFKSQEEYLCTLSEMDTIDPPEVYGLHANADIAYQTDLATTILNNIVSIQPKESSADGVSRETIVVSRVKDMLKNFPAEYNPFEVKKALQNMGTYNPMVIFLRQELDRMQKIIKTIRISLNDLLLANEGKIIMNEQQKDISDDVFNTRLPTTWRKISWESSTLGFWFNELLERDKQFKNWCFNGRPMIFWMSGFFNPQGFLTSMRQEVARAHNWTLDTVAIHNTVLTESNINAKNKPQEGVLVHGLYIDGASWDVKKSLLIEPQSKILYTAMPVIHIYAINSLSAKHSALYESPLYKKVKRTDLNFVTPLWLKSSEPVEHWILRGVALLCDIQ